MCNIENNATVAILLNALHSVLVSCLTFSFKFWTGSAYVAKDILKPETILSQFPEFWDYP